MNKTFIFSSAHATGVPKRAVKSRARNAPYVFHSLIGFSSFGSWGVLRMYSLQIIAERAVKVFAMIAETALPKLFP
jgi:hypothetical protein